MNKLYIIVGTLIVLFIGVAIYFRAPEQPRLGEEQVDYGGTHVEQKDYSGVEPPTSGDHAEAIAWGYYDEPQADVNTLHNLEHGGIYVTYTDELSEKDITELRELLFEPFSDKSFAPKKVIMAPRPDNKSKLVISSWNRSIKLDGFDKVKVTEYYKSNFNKSPEPLAY